jgi:hypothetical protein
MPIILARAEPAPGDCSFSYLEHLALKCVTKVIVNIPISSYVSNGYVATLDSEADGSVAGAHNGI